MRPDPLELELPIMMVTRMVGLGTATRVMRIWRPLPTVTLHAIESTMAPNGSEIPRLTITDSSQTLIIRARSELANTERIET